MRKKTDQNKSLLNFVSILDLIHTLGINFEMWNIKLINIDDLNKTKENLKNNN